MQPFKKQCFRLPFGSVSQFLFQSCLVLRMFPFLLLWLPNYLCLHIPIPVAPVFFFSLKCIHFLTGDFSSETLKSIYGLGHNSVVGCLACTKPWVPYPILKTKKQNNLQFNFPSFFPYKLRYHAVSCVCHCVQLSNDPIANVRSN